MTPKSSGTAGFPPPSRTPPHSAEAEQGALGCILLSPNDCLSECVEKLKPGHLAFHDLRHQTLFRALVEMMEKAQPIDIITIQQHLKDGHQIENAGGLGYISGLSDAVPSAGNLQYYLNIVLEKYLLRKMLQTCAEISRRIHDCEGEVDALLDEAEKDILAIRADRDRDSGSSFTAKDLVNRAIAKIEEYHQNQGVLTGIGTGFVDFDRLTTGMHGGDMIVIAARPSVGKTALAMNIVEHVILESKVPVGVFSLEMTADQLMMRLLCSRARVNLRDIRDGFLAERDFPKLTAAAGRLATAPVFIDDTGGMSILQLRAKARRMWQQFGIKMFVIDYLQLLHSTSRKADNRQQEISEISAGIKALAKELDVPIIVLSQLNRELEKRGKGERPKMSDIRESGSIEQDADLVGLLYRPSQGDSDGDDQEDAEREAVPVKLFVAKQRNGPTGDVDLTFIKSWTRFESAARIQPQN